MFNNHDIIANYILKTYIKDKSHQYESDQLRLNNRREKQKLYNYKKISSHWTQKTISTLI